MAGDGMNAPAVTEPCTLRAASRPTSPASRAIAPAKPQPRTPAKPKAPIPADKAGELTRPSTPLGREQDSA
ncbi:MAG: hypothetical protein ACLSVD_11765 [Eggerthellaceae bacterium]